MPPPGVGVVEVQPERVEELIEFSGQVEAVRRIEVRSPVAGVIVAQPIREGAEVRAGDVLFQIDPTTYDAAWRSARARLTDAEARHRNAQRTLGRLRPLLAENAVAQRDVDDAEAAEAMAGAAVEEARGALDRARKDLDDATIKAEIGGRVGRANLLLGARVTGPTELLTTIDQLDPLHVTFRPPASQLLQWRRNPATAAALRPGGRARVRVVLADAREHPVAGRLDYVDPVVEAETGTQTLRARVANPGRLLLPGQFVRVRLQGLERDSAIVVPQRAVQQSLGKQYVYLLAAGDTVVSRDVEATAWVGDKWIIERGLSAGDRVIVDGFQKVRPGMVAAPLAQTAKAAP